MKKFKTNLARFLSVVLLLLFVGCDETGMVSSVEPELPDLKMECFMDQGVMQFVATGAFEDSGIVEGTPIPRHEVEEEFFDTYREFTGKKGQFWMQVEVTIQFGQKRIAEGTFRIIHGTGAYAGMDAEGTFKAEIGKDGALVEFFDGRTIDEF